MIWSMNVGRLFEERRNNEELLRRDNYQKHVSLIAGAQFCTYEELMQNLCKILPLKKPDRRYLATCTDNCLPVSSSQNIFETITQNKRLSPEEKADLFSFISCELNYKLYTDFTLKPPYLSLYDVAPDKLLKVYSKTVKHHLISPEIELQIFDKLYNGNNGNNILCALFNNQDNKARILNFIDFWFNKITSPAVLAGAYHAAAGYNTTCMHTFSKLVKELYEQRLLELHIIMRMNANLNSEHNNIITMQFITRCCLFKSRYNKLYELTFTNLPLATEQLVQYKIQLEKEINIKLENCAYAKPEVTFRYKSIVSSKSFRI